MPATSKAELLTITDKEFGKLAALIADIRAEKAMLKDEAETSIKDVISHRAHWIDLFLGWYHDGLAGKEVHFPAPGYKWNELKRHNAALRVAQAGMGWAEAKDSLVSTHRKLRHFVERAPEHDLYGGPMKGAKNEWTPGR